MNLELKHLLLLAGVLDLTVFSASVSLNAIVRPREHLAKLPIFLNQLARVAYGYILLNILAIGVIAIVNHEELASGSMLARSLCAYAAIFWGVRLAITFWYDVREYLTKPWRRVAYAALNVNFCVLTAIFALGALRP